MVICTSLGNFVETNLWILIKLWRNNYRIIPLFTCYLDFYLNKINFARNFSFPAIEGKWKSPCQSVCPSVHFSLSFLDINCFNECFFCCVYLGVICHILYFCWVLYRCYICYALLECDFYYVFPAMLFLHVFQGMLFWLCVLRDVRYDIYIYWYILCVSTDIISELSFKDVISIKRC